MNKKTKQVQKGEIYYAELSGTVGSEQGGIRPVLIIQNDVGNRNSPTSLSTARRGAERRLPC